MKHPQLKAFRLLLVLVGVIALAGCTHLINPPKTAFMGYPSREKIHLQLALNLTDELRQTKWEDHSMFGDTFIIPIGKSIAENAPVLARHTFTSVRDINNGGIPPDPIDAVLTPKVPYINRTLGATSFSKSIISIKVEWTLTDPTGNSIWADTVTGEGGGSTGWTNPENILKTAWEDALKKSQRTLWYSRAIREFAQKKYPEVKIMDPPIRIARPEVLKLCDTLSSSDVDQVMDALKALRKMDAPEAVPEILPCLEHSEPNVIRDACRTLAVLGNKDTIPFIEPLLKHQRSDVRKDAQDAISKLSAKP